MDWDRLIQPLARGSYKVDDLMRRLRELGYAGPVGLQCYNFKGDPKDNLARSLSAWRNAVGLAPGTGGGKTEQP